MGKKSFWAVEAVSVATGRKEKGMGQPRTTFPSTANRKSNTYRTPDEMMWVRKSSSIGQTGCMAGTGMLPVVQPNGFISEENGRYIYFFINSTSI
jgi:hypothetical protein